MAGLAAVFPPSQQVRQVGWQAEQEVWYASPPLLPEQAQATCSERNLASAPAAQAVSVQKPSASQLTKVGPHEG